MMKNKNKPEQTVAYLKVSAYFKSFLEVKYGTPVQFPSMTNLSTLVERFIVNNPSMVELTSFSYCSQAFHHQSERSLFEMDLSLPSDEERDSFIPIVLPDTVYRGTSEFAVTDTWQFSKAGAKELRREIGRDYWITFFNFIDDCFLQARCKNEKCTRENAISDFLTIYNIDMSWYETMIRYDNRNRQRIGREIEQRRAALEEKTGRPYSYT